MDLSEEFGLARDQGCRPTCLAFAASDTHAHVRGYPEVALSPEYAFYYAAKLMGAHSSHGGVSLNSMLSALEKEGQPEESHYPYFPVQPSLTLPVPPVPFPTPVFKRHAYPQSSEIAQLLASLRSKTPLIVVLDITHQFDRAEGNPALVELVADDTVRGRHAVIAVGLAGAVGRGVYIKIRNSWGRGWGNDGHAWLSLSYLERQLVSTVRFQ